VRVLQIQTFHYYRGGDSTYMFNLSGLLESRGHEVAHFAMRHPDNLPSTQEEYFVSEVDFPRLLERRTPAAALKVLGRSIYSGEARRNISRLIDDIRPEIAHIHNCHSHLTTSILEPLRRAGVPIVWTLHDYRLVCPNSDFLSGYEICERCLPNRFHHVVLRRCKKGSFAASFVAMSASLYDRMTRVPSRVQRFIAPSRFLAGKLVEGGFDPARITHLPNFVDAGAFPARPEGDYALYFGRLSREKGVDVLLEALALAQRGRLKIAGDGPQRAELERRAAELGLGGVEFLGYRSGDELKEILAGAQFVVLPSRWYENLPFSIMEALAAGKPVIASDLGGIPEMIEDGVNGLLFPAGDAGELARRLVLLLDSPEQRESMGRTGRQKALELYNADYHYQRIIDIYGDVAGRKGGL
jgi:glycosyltransferase involved in cell wall biosynthesis